MKHIASTKSLLILLLTVCSITAKPQQTGHTIILDKMNYLLQLPEGYETDTVTQWPLMVFLHGVGECGDEIEKVKLLGPPRMIEDGKKYPFIVVSPQSPERGWRSHFLEKLIIDIKDTYRVDEDRVYLTGLSMGGFGTWNTAQSMPDLFAAIVPICGGGDPDRAWALQNMPIWCFHGAKDDDVDISYSKKMIEALEPYNNPNVKFTVYPEAGHDSWTETYNNEEVYEWMLSHKRFTYEEVDISDDLLNEYAGTYTSSHGDTVNLVVAGKELQTEREGIVYSSFKPASDTKFFKEREITIEFSRGAKNKVSEFTIYWRGYSKEVYKKL